MSEVVDVFKLCSDCGAERDSCTCSEFVQRTENDRVCQRFLGRWADPASATPAIMEGVAIRHYCAHIERRHGADGRCLVPGCVCHAPQLPPPLDQPYLDDPRTVLRDEANALIEVEMAAGYECVFVRPPDSLRIGSGCRSCRQTGEHGHHYRVCMLKRRFEDRKIVRFSFATLCETCILDEVAQAKVVDIIFGVTR